MKDVYIYPSLPKGKVIVPPSKSVLHRAIICASLASEESFLLVKLKESSLSLDIKATIKAMQDLGAKIIITSKGIRIKGITSFSQVNNTNLNVLESGSTLRFILPLLSLFPFSFNITMKEGLYNRPMDVYKKFYDENNALLEKGKGKIKVCGELKPGEFDIDGNVSSQFISGLLFLMPLLDKTSILHVHDLKSQGYVELTIAVLNDFGIKVIKNNNDYIIEGNQTYKGRVFKIEGDYTQAVNFLVLDLLNESSNIEILGLDKNSMQTDRDFYEKLFSMKEKNDLNNLIFDIDNNPDLGPILAVLLAKYGGVIKNTQRLKIKESNRLESIIEEFKKFNIETKVVNDNLYIQKKEIIKTNQVIDSHNDHRIFMAMVILSSIAKSKVRIKDYECANKSYPDFLKDIQELNIKIEKI